MNSFHLPEVPENKPNHNVLPQMNPIMNQPTPVALKKPMIANNEPVAPFK